ncbi:CgeB family protein [Haloarcula litorea]|uniref:CgeB family protein n=1 Tax=Haloarcula litorea TaxID=3032579 RepID=UPI0023E8C5D9|nr:glycosyltransferase [Halomicroarcula sp. GDY20]
MDRPDAASLDATDRNDPLRILSVVSTIDLGENVGCTPAWWQLHKALHECGNEVIVTPYLGDDVESPWWRTRENPCYWESRLYKAVADRLDLSAGSDAGTEGLVQTLTNGWTKRRWQSHLDEVVEEERPDVVLFFNVPLNQIGGLPSRLRDRYDVPVVYYDGDMPTILPEHVEERGFRFNYYDGADLTEYDAFVTNSEGVHDRLRSMGARAVHSVHYGVDPGVYAPVDVPYEYDVSFFGSGAAFREERTRNMITKPARQLDADFVVGGRGYEIDLGDVERAGWIPVNGFRRFCNSARINLNITREGHRTVYKSSTSRPFELAAMGCCVVSDPYDGLGEWFDIGEEMYVAETAEEAMDLYEWLLDDDELREATGRKARERVLADHTFRDRANELVDILRQQ